MARFEISLVHSKQASRSFWFAVVLVCSALLTVANSLVGWLISIALVSALLFWAHRYHRSGFQGVRAIEVGYDTSVVLITLHNARIPVTAVGRHLITDWCCRLSLKSTEIKEPLPKGWHQRWLWRDSMSDKDYRRLCRCLIQWQRLADAEVSTQDSGA
ncbi:protein YgfX [Corallincola platygyrae]|uniref:Protein YgfX n=1 Tax=Corallincola platygyrae TaxID=1193278 RepID=A0ABW4XLF0_9GAMM